MATKNEQFGEFGELQRKNMEAAMKVAQLSIENSQRIMALQSDLAKELFEKSVANAKAQTSAKDPQQIIKLRTEYAQETAQRMIEAAKAIAEIGNASRAEFSRLLTDQLAGGKNDLMDAFQSFFKVLPGQNSNVLETMQQAMANANSAFEQIAQSSAAAFSNMGEQVTKATASRKK